MKAQIPALREWLNRISMVGQTYRWLRRLKRRLQQKMGIIPEKCQSRQEYWENRASKLHQEDRAILDPNDPYAQAQAEFLRELAQLQWLSLLEVGCGYGRLLHDVIREYSERKVVGVDFSFSQLKHGIDYLPPPVRCSQAYAHQLPFTAQSVDIIVTVAMLICIHPRELNAVLTEFKRVSRRYVVALEYAREHMQTPGRLRLMEEAPWHGHNYQAAFDACGIRVARSYPFHAFDSQPDRIPLSLILGEIEVR